MVKIPLTYKAGGKTRYVIESYDAMNITIKKYYISKAKGHEGNETSRVIGYYGSVRHALNELMDIGLREAVVAGEELEKVEKRLEEMIENATK